MDPATRPSAIWSGSHPPAMPGRSGLRADPGIHRRWTPRAVTLLRGAVRDRSGPAAPRARLGFPRERHDIVSQFVGTAQGSWLETEPLRDHTDSTPFSSRDNHALARLQSRLTVRGEMSRAATISSSVRPPK